jgi:transposase
VARSVPVKRRRYSDEFKVRAVKLALHRDVQVQDVAAALDVHPFMLSRWKREYREGRLRAAASSLPAKSVRQQSRLRRLERQVALLKVEIKVLKKAIHLFLHRKRKPLDS